jgi:hypothetical protein
MLETTVRQLDSIGPTSARHWPYVASAPLASPPLPQTGIPHKLYSTRSVEQEFEFDGNDRAWMSPRSLNMRASQNDLAAHIAEKLQKQQQFMSSLRQV